MSAQDEHLPGGVSGQNREEAEPGHGSGAERKGSEDDRKGRKHGSGSSGGSGGSGGEASEGSQSTGDPNSAG